MQSKYLGTYSSARCYPPTKFHNGIFSPKKHSFLFKDKLFFKCSYGFSLSIKKKYIRCGLNGEWKIPHCKRSGLSTFITLYSKPSEPRFSTFNIFTAFCYDPGTIPHGSISKPRILHLAGQTVNYTCDEGYFLSPKKNKILTCQSSGQWNTTPPICHKSKYIYYFYKYPSTPLLDWGAPA